MLRDLKELEVKFNKAQVPSEKLALLDAIAVAKKELEQFKLLATNINTLNSWMVHDILEVAGPDFNDRIMLYDFIVAELKALEVLHPHRIKAARIALQQQKNNTLQFVLDMEQEFVTLAADLNISVADLWQLCELHRCQRFSDKYCERSAKILDKLGSREYVLAFGLVGQVISSTVRASSIVENLNGRVKPYYELRKQTGKDFSELLKFFLNHKPLNCNRIDFRKNKTPTEILTGQSHPSWLEMLGFDKVCVNY